MNSTKKSAPQPGLFPHRDFDPAGLGASVPDGAGAAVGQPLQPKVRDIPLDRVRTDGGTQIRLGGFNDETVSDYAEHIDQLPPVDVYFDGEDYWLADGFHRYDAHGKASRLTMLCRVHMGSKRDAQLHALGANSRHGLRRTNADKRHAVEILLYDDEWRLWSDRKIAKAAGVTHPYVSSLRKEVAEFQRLADEDAAEALEADEAYCPVSGNGYHPRSGREERHPPKGVEPVPPASSASGGDEDKAGDPEDVDAAANRDEPYAPGDAQLPWVDDYNSTLAKCAERMRAIVVDLKRLAGAAGMVGGFASWADKGAIAKLENWVTTLQGQRIVRHANEWEMVHLPCLPGEPEPRSFIYASDYLKGPLCGKKQKGARS